mmetsp:Transcript_14263/g.29191  ORF Transcript_14263/g.29191 Transcript_14263/m.29191 type:complete len:271 (-) Transcript_14263:84-896(-)
MLAVLQPPLSNKRQGVLEAHIRVPLATRMRAPFPYPNHLIPHRQFFIHLFNPLFFFGHRSPPVQPQTNSPLVAEPQLFRPFPNHPHPFSSLLRRPFIVYHHPWLPRSHFSIAPPYPPITPLAFMNDGPRCSNENVRGFIDGLHGRPCHHGFPRRRSAFLFSTFPFRMWLEPSSSVLKPHYQLHQWYIPLGCHSTKFFRARTPTMLKHLRHLLHLTRIWMKPPESLLHFKNLPMSSTVSRLHVNVQDHPSTSERTLISFMIPLMFDTRSGS